MPLLAAALGLAVGPLLNHLADCLPRHRSILQPPTCGFCGTPLRRSQWLGLVALLTKKYACQSCAKPLSHRRWLLEIGLAVLYAALAWRHLQPWHLLAACVHGAVLLLVTVTDLEHRKVPDAAIVPASGAALVLSFATCRHCLPAILLGGLLAFIVFLALALAYRGAMGFGDVTLAGYVGLIAGFPRVLPCLLVTALAGGLVAAFLLLTRRATRKTYIPYAPFLVLGGLLALFCP
ncbi:MAG: prepilin peptidase [Anaerolineae bacterium]